VSPHRRPVEESDMSLLAVTILGLTVSGYESLRGRTAALREPVERRRSGVSRSDRLFDRFQRIYLPNWCEGLVSPSWWPPPEADGGW
jgi:hypothetical protein